MHHVPRHGGSRRRPGLLPERLVALNRDEVAIGRNLTVHVCGRDLHRAVCRKAARRFLHQGKRLWHDVGEDLLKTFIHLELQRVDLFKQRFLFVQFGEWEIGRLRLQLGDVFQLTFHVGLDAGPKLCGLRSQLVCAQPRQ